MHPDVSAIAFDASEYLRVRGDGQGQGKSDNEVGQILPSIALM